MDSYRVQREQVVRTVVFASFHKEAGITTGGSNCLDHMQRMAENETFNSLYLI